MGEAETMMDQSFDIIVVGAGPAGMMAAIAAGKRGRRVLLLEKLPFLGSKLRASGGGRCNLTNTLEKDQFMARFGRGGRFMSSALDALGNKALMDFFAGIGVPCHSPDGFRVFPETHDSGTVVAALEAELARLGVIVMTSQRVECLNLIGERMIGVKTPAGSFTGRAGVILATGGLGYPSLGAEGDGYSMAREVGHKVTGLFPAMLPLKTRERWVERCRADTIGKAIVRIDLPEAKKLRATGDLIFTAQGIRGPVVLDIAREITPLLEKHGSVPLLVNLTKGMNEEEVRVFLKKRASTSPENPTVAQLEPLIPGPLATELCGLSGVDPKSPHSRIPPIARDRLIKLLTWTPLTVTGHDGFPAAMITRGGIPLGEVFPETLESRICRGLFLCGEIVDLDGPCGGFNLQWAFSSGFLAGKTGKTERP